MHAEYTAWLERVRITFEAVSYTCGRRLRDPDLGRRVGVQVVAGLVSRPAVFRYFGLPYSGRIAALAEPRIADAAAGSLAPACGWDELRERLEAVPADVREVLVAVCVRGEDVATLAAGLRCDEAVAGARREAMLAVMREVAAPGLGGLDPDPKE